MVGVTERDQGLRGGVKVGRAALTIRQGTDGRRRMARHDTKQLYLRALAREGCGQVIGRAR